jgi:hypothetical protein
MAKVLQRRKVRAKELRATDHQKRVKEFPVASVTSHNIQFIDRVLPRYLVFNISTIPTWNDNGIMWIAPSSFEMYSNGDWVLSAAKYYNARQTIGRPFSVRWWFNVQYLNAQKAPVYTNRYLADEEGYGGSTSNVVKSGDDAGFVHWLDQIAWAKWWQSWEIFY